MKKPLALLAALPVVALLAACGASAEDDGKTSVVASFYPLAFVTEQVGGSFVDVQNLTSPGVEPHDLELKAKQVAAVQDADLVVYEKEFQSAVDEAVDQAGRSDDDTVDVDSEIDLLASQEGAEHEEHGEEHEGHEHGAEDPHTWLDPTNMVTITQAVAAKLSAVDPDHADDYRANADALVARLEKLDRSFETGLKTCERRTIVTTHAAFQYLAKRYDLHQVPIAGIDPTNEPSPSQLGDITTLVKREGITTIFTEELVSPDIADTIAKETGATTATLDPIEGLSDRTSTEDYVSLMEKNLATLTKANGCS